MIEIENITDIINHLDEIKTVIFDMDDTLYGEKEYVRSGYVQVALCVPKIKNAEEKLWRYFLQGKNAIDQLLISEGIFNDQLKQRCVDAYRFQKPNIHLYEGVQMLLLSLKKQGYNLGIITDGRVEGQRAKIETLGLSRFVDKIIITDELGGVEYRKPNEKSYTLMKEFFGVEYCQMAYVGDNPKKDFIACEKLGIRPVYFVNKDGLYSKRC